jgi:hypothetical protein
MRATLLTLGLLATSVLTLGFPASEARASGLGDAVKKKLAKQAEGLFDKADANHDGKISPEEFRKAIARLPMLKLKPAVVDRLFRELDTNHDGYLTRPELKQLEAKLKKLAPGMAKAALGKAVSKIKDTLAGKLKGLLK